jgi:hydrogenase maturation factor HypF (carbamoyltransferase family)
MEEEKCHKCYNIIRFIPDGKIQERKKLSLCELCYKIYENSFEYKYLIQKN